ncbi:dihydrolipoamide acetyltransferase family protein [Natrinema gelatinilyticum]|uniref:dihydrolipoamide acetyltransferase family protein n=1 Tax=Natrinema gelatinilyticum TaxID=2961571 RepID=UPI0020C24488|nr:dihydrolipoamide acetyltransferase family protein [Natrinema gelatinilyticum]
MTRIQFELPDVGEGVAEGQLLEWHVELGDSVTESQIIAEVETDKAVVDVPAPVDGTVVDRRAEAGDIVPVGDVLVVFEVGSDGEEKLGEQPESGAEPEIDDGTASPDATETDDTTGSVDGDIDGGNSANRVFAAPSVRRLARELDVDITAVDSSGPGRRVTEHDVRRVAGTTEAEPSSDGATATAWTSADHGDASGSEITAVAVDGTDARVRAAQEQLETTAVTSADRDETLALPGTRALAHELGVDINEVPTSETYDGEPLVTDADVRTFADATTEHPATTAANGQTAEAATEETTAGERVPYRGIRRTIGEQMKRARFTAPHATHHESVDVSELVAVRDELGDVAEAKGMRLTFTPFFLKAVVAGLREYPLLNSRLDEEAEEIICYDHYHVGVAVDTEHGLMVPVVENVDEKSIATLANDLARLVERAQDRSLTAGEMQGSTFTVSNGGSLGGEYATPIINYPEAAVLGFGAIRSRPWVVDGEVVARPVLPLSLSFDHRVVDGGTAARFVGDVMDYLRDPRRLLLE